MMGKRLRVKNRTYIRWIAGRLKAKLIHKAQNHCMYESIWSLEWTDFLKCSLQEINNIVTYQIPYFHKYFLLNKINMF